MARFAYDAAKSAARLRRAKGAHDDLVLAAHRLQGDALKIEARAKYRLAEEYDAAQERGEVASRGQPRNVPDENIKPDPCPDPPPGIFFYADSVSFIGVIGDREGVAQPAHRARLVGRAHGRQAPFRLPGRGAGQRVGGRVLVPQRRLTRPPRAACRQAGQLRRPGARAGRPAGQARRRRQRWRR
jgi:hypothetical protein